MDSIQQRIAFVESAIFGRTTVVVLMLENGAQVTGSSCSM
jgi:hypothetical protein